MGRAEIIKKMILLAMPTRLQWMSPLLSVTVTWQMLTFLWGIDSTY